MEPSKSPSISTPLASSSPAGGSSCVLPKTYVSVSICDLHYRVHGQGLLHLCDKAELDGVRAT